MYVQCDAKPTVTFPAAERHRPSAGAKSYCLRPIHTSNSVEATFDFIEATFDFVAKNGNNVEQVFREISMFNFQFLCSICFDFVENTKISFDIVSGVHGDLVAMM